MTRYNITNKCKIKMRKEEVKQEEHVHEFQYDDFYKDNGDGTCSLGNGKCKYCEVVDPNIPRLAHSYIYFDVEKAGFFGWKYSTKCERCGAIGVENQRSSTEVKNGDKYLG